MYLQWAFNRRKSEAKDRREAQVPGMKTSQVVVQSHGDLLWLEKTTPIAFTVKGLVTVASDDRQSRIMPKVSM